MTNQISMKYTLLLYDCNSRTSGYIKNEHVFRKKTCFRNRKNSDFVDYVYCIDFNCDDLFCLVCSNSAVFTDYLY